MKQFFNRFLAALRVGFCTVMVALTGGAPAYAQGGGVQDLGNQVLGEGVTTFKTLMTNFTRFLQIALGAGALVMLVLAVYQLMKGERDAAQKMAYWVIGLALGFALISIVYNRINSI